MKDKFINEGLYSIPEKVDVKVCENILKEIKSTREFGKNLFLEENKYSNIHLNTNPGYGNDNILDNFDEELSIIENDPSITHILDKILGKNYNILLRKIVCGVPLSWIPEWIQNSIKDRCVNNLGAFIKKEYRDITYFHGIDMHQDIIDFAGEDCDFITLYIYLDNVTANDAPLYVVPGSYKFGPTVFPHNIDNFSRSSCIYEGVEMPVICLTGERGSASLWHSCTLHGTQPTRNDSERISLRYLIKKDKDDNGCIMSKMNNNFKASVTRSDLNDYGIAVKKGNKINNISQ